MQISKDPKIGWNWPNINHALSPYNGYIDIIAITQLRKMLKA